MMRGLLLLLAAACFLVTPTVANPVQLYGLNYNTRKGPDWDWEKCKTREEILTDLSLLQRLTPRIRLLSLTDCGQGELVLGVAKELGLQLWLGLWVSQYDYVFEDEVNALESILNRGLIDDTTVLGITVGSESIYRKEVKVSDIIGYKNQVKTLLTDANLDLPVSIVDIAPTYDSNPELTDAVDVVYTNTFPFWEGIAIENAIDYLVSDLNSIIRQPEAQNKDLILGETGWPSDGFISGVGTASAELQTQFFVDFYCEMHIKRQLKYFYFTGIDNAWRQEQDPDNTIEGNWGFFEADLMLKPHFQELVFTCPGASTEYTFSELDLTLEEFTPPPSTPAPTTVASCKAHAECAALDGNCCPNDSGDFLGCCGDTSTSAPPGTTPDPQTTAPPTASPSSAEDDPPPTTSPTVTPTESPVADSTTAAPTPEDDPPPTAAPTTPTTNAQPTPSTTATPTLRATTMAPSANDGDAPPTGSPTASPTADGVSTPPTVSPTEQGATESPSMSSPTPPPLSFDNNNDTTASSSSDPSESSATGRGTIFALMFCPLLAVVVF